MLVALKRVIGECEVVGLRDLFDRQRGFLHMRIFLQVSLKRAKLGNLRLLGGLIMVCCFILNGRIQRLLRLGLD